VAGYRSIRWVARLNRPWQTPDVEAFCDLVERQSDRPNGAEDHPKRGCPWASSALTIFQRRAESRIWIGPITC